MSDRKILVTGGAGYVGSHTCLALAEAGYLPVTFDNLSNGHADFVQWGPLEVGDIRDRARLDSVMKLHRPVAIMHFAALIEVGDSVRHPGAFFDTNVAGAINVIEAASEIGVNAMVFSSTCATYGSPRQLPVAEDQAQLPLNPYGRSKLMVEQILSDKGRYSNFRSISLRYFNAAGADPEGRIGERHDPETHAIPLAIQTALGQRAVFKLFGQDYDTRDGTAVRDYVHVMDLADAHVLALSHLLTGGFTDHFNLGTGEGTTVRELIATIAEVAGQPLMVECAARRDGDASSLVADSTRARDILGWAPTRSIEQIIQSAWAWHVAEVSRS